MSITFSIVPILNYTAGFIHGNASLDGRKPNPKYTYSFLGTSTFFALGYVTNIKPPVHPLFAVTASILGTGGMFCMGHMTARIADDN